MFFFLSLDHLRPGTSSLLFWFCDFSIAWQWKVVQDYGTRCKSNEVADPLLVFQQKKAMVRSSSKKKHLNKNHRFSLQKQAMIYLPQRRNISKRPWSQNVPGLTKSSSLFHRFATFETLTWHSMTYCFGSWRDPCFTAYFNLCITRGGMSSPLSQRILK